MNRLISGFNIKTNVNLKQYTKVSGNSYNVTLKKNPQDSQNKSCTIYEYYLVFKDIYSISKEVLATKWFWGLGVHDTQEIVIMEYECYTFCCDYS